MTMYPPLVRVEATVGYKGFSVVLCVLATACSGNPLPPPNSVRASFEGDVQAVQVYVSNAQMPSAAWLVDASGTRYPLVVTLVSGPHVNYSTPPSVGLGLG